MLNPFENNNPRKPSIPKNESIKVIINLKSFDKFFFQGLISRLSLKNIFFRIFKLPSTFTLNTLIRSPFVNKKSRLQIGFKVYKWRLELQYDLILTKKMILNLLLSNLADSHKVSWEIFLSKKSFYF